MVPSLVMRTTTPTLDELVSHLMPILRGFIFYTVRCAFLSLPVDVQKLLVDEITNHVDNHMQG